MSARYVFPTGNGCFNGLRAAVIREGTIDDIRSGCTPFHGLCGPEVKFIFRVYGPWIKCDGVGTIIVVCQLISIISEVPVIKASDNIY